MPLAIGAEPLTPLVEIDHLASQPGGQVTAVFADGSVLSVQPDGTQQKRPAGTAGPYELAKVSGTVIVYRPIPGKVFVFALETALPNV